MSVLTDERFFYGHLDHLVAVREAVDIPLIRKDFIIDDRQIAQADWSVLIVFYSSFPASRMGTFATLAGLPGELGMDVLVEVHDADEAARAVALDCDMIGVNNRNLSTFETSLEHTFELLPGLMAADRVVVSESGIENREQCARLEAAGVDAILVGETLMRAGDPATELKRLRGTPDGNIVMIRVKMCGFTRMEDVKAAAQHWCRCLWL